MSVDYRLLPQAKPEEIWEDVKDAYEFVVDALPGVLGLSNANRGIRKVVVAGASAGMFLPVVCPVILELRWSREGWI